MIVVNALFCLTLLQLVADMHVCSLPYSEMLHHSKKVVASFSGNDTVHVIDSVLDVSIQDCISACKDRTACTYINYMTRAHLCHLVTSYTLIVPLVLVTPGIVYGKKEEWSTTDLCTGCDHEGQVCLNKSQPTGPCVVTGCGPPHIPNSDVIVRGNDFSIGSNVQQRCDITPPDWNNITCLENGTWSNSSFDCAGSVQCDGIHCYFISPQLMTWSEATAYCDANFIYLLYVSTTSENAAVNAILSTLNFADYWFGGNDIQQEGQWVWDASNRPLNETFSGFTRLPPPYDTSKNCLLVLGGSLTWTAEDCSTLHPFICET